MSKNIVHRYFKKEEAGVKRLVQINPIHFTGIQITINQLGKIEAAEMDSNQNLEEICLAQGFKENSPLEFNLYYAGIIDGEYKPEENN
jgi:hypothetical protein